MKRIVIKIGSASLVHPHTGCLNATVAKIIAGQISKVRQWGTEVVLVTSGAIAAGKYRMFNVSQSQSHRFPKQAYAGVGARHLLNLWGDAFEAEWLDVAQIWVTHANWSNPHERLSIQANLSAYMQNHFVIPLVNENDVVSDQEIILMERGISENDQLARMVAELIQADGIMFITSPGGVYDKNPLTNPDAQRISRLTRSMIERIDVPAETSEGGTGGMATKLIEAFTCSDRGMRVAIAGAEEEVIEKFVLGNDVGTMIEGSLSVV